MTARPVHAARVYHSDEVTIKGRSTSREKNLVRVNAIKSKPQPIRVDRSIHCLTIRLRIYRNNNRTSAERATSYHTTKYHQCNTGGISRNVNPYSSRRDSYLPYHPHMSAVNVQIEVQLNRVWFRDHRSPKKEYIKSLIF